ncbi:MAG: hypothetical protein GEV05_16655 [Betaproteobacteria bacterium]|nr:hypothetical protein [Betaproteobacteria bacterium]
MPLGLLGGGFDSSGAAADEFDDWYDTEHIPERMRIPGFLNAVRWIGVSNPRISLAIYDLESLDVLKKPEYRAVSPENFSPWSKRILLGKCTRLCRFNCVQMGAGDQVAPEKGTGLFVVAFNSAAEFEPGLDRWIETEHLPRLAAVPGVLRARWFKTPADSPGSSSHKHVVTCHLDSPSICDSPAWGAALEGEGMHEMRRHMKDILPLALRRYTRRA